VLMRNRQSRTTLALLQTFHARTRFWLSRLIALLPPPPPSPPPPPPAIAATRNSTDADDSPAPGTDGPVPETVQLTPRDVLELNLSPLSTLDTRFVEWLAEEYAAGPRTRVSVRRGWRDLLGLIFAVGSGTSSPSS
jgi:hypothetical protein